MRNKGEPVFVHSAQTVTASGQNALHYDWSASGPIIFTYVNGNPVSFVDPDGRSPLLVALGGAVAFYGGMTVVNAFYNTYANLSLLATSSETLSAAVSACNSYPSGGACGALPNLQQQVNQCAANSVRAGANIPGTLTTPKFPATRAP